MSTYHSKSLPVGAVVLIDGKTVATVVKAFPKGSPLFAFPHYRVNVENDDREFAVVAMDRCTVKSVSLFDLSKSIRRNEHD